MSKILIVAAAALSAGLAANADAASFNCGAAKTPTEHAICGNPQLSSLDDQTAGMYFTLISNGSLSPNQVSAVKAAQAKFLTERNACGANFNCLVDAYTSQMMYLKATANP